MSASRLPPDVIEHIHDVLVGVFLPFDENVRPGEYRNRSLIESAAGRPFQTAFGEEVYPTIPQKGAALFHSLACNHCFFNGNKRTAVIGLDIFMSLNGMLLALTSNEVYELAKSTVQANAEGKRSDDVVQELANKIANASVEIEALKDPKIKERLGPAYVKIMQHAERFLRMATRLMNSASQQNKSGNP